ncbi:zonular occludens toxin family protein [Pectobacterium aquaticum]|uniref:zonular occludens toxin family protein n=1 Tax=Pectobacterium aquaticum TaxID=2204145 RepID=UPI000E238EA7|nr:zonular occludens toxin domain-containing protein [Pectobacterium aquaticum]UEM37661.1 hypothetical protein DMB82_0010585 [Pectobacterium aquaticum]UEM37674.1 hypothetical protein DMB82_0010650 [Pectobacterium aquaticum]
MSITAYIGINGSGKTYEVVRSVMLPAFLNGRRIVTNIEGVTHDNFMKFILNDEKLKDITPGIVIPVSDDDVNKEDFLPYKGAGDTFCKPGDLICIDEAWRFWETDKMLLKGHRSFFAEHRHFSDKDSGFTCDIVVISQDLGTLCRFIKSRIETTYRMQKHLALGLAKRYRVDVYMGAKPFTKYLTSSYQEKYNPQYFSLYRSHDEKNAKEARVDKRQNIFRQTKLWVVLFFSIMSISVAIFFVYSFLNRGQENNQKIVHAQKTEPAAPLSSVAAPSPPVATLPLSRTWKISGTLKAHGADFVIISDSNGVFRLIGKEVFIGQGMMMYALIDNERVTYFSGSMK